MIADFALRKLPLSVRWAVIIVLGIVVLVAIVCVYGQIDGIIWSSELTRLIGHPYSDVLRLKSRSTGFDLLESDRELYAVRQHFTPPTDIVPRGKVILAYRHRPPGLWNALLFLDERDVVYAIHVGALDTYGLELYERNVLRKPQPSQSE